MKVGVTIWGNRISPVFDVSNKLMLVDIKNGEIVNKTYKDINRRLYENSIDFLIKYCIDVLICGAIDENQIKAIENYNIFIIPFISGHAEKVLSSFVINQHDILNFLMPGLFSIPDFNKLELVH